MTIALVGNPNCGKTTLFNALTGGKIRTGNWPGVTVEKREGLLKAKQDLVIVDLPGIYSFAAHSEDQVVARDYILSAEPDLIVNVVDASNLERNLFLTSQLIEMQVPFVVVLNMIDTLAQRNITIDVKQLSQRLGVDVLECCAVKKDSVAALSAFLCEAEGYAKRSVCKLVYPKQMEVQIKHLQEKIAAYALGRKISTRWLAVKLLESDSRFMADLQQAGDLSLAQLQAFQQEIEDQLEDPADLISADVRFELIQSIADACVKRDKHKKSLSDKIDSLVLNRIAGIPIFLAVMYLLFWVTISVGGAFIDFFDLFTGTIFVDGFTWLLASLGSPNWLTIVLANGIGGGIQTVASFIPIIFFLFLMLSLLEDSGYMARAAFVMDRFMRKIGLPGKAFVPLLVGFGCTVPAIMGARTLEDNKERVLTVFMAPFMSCGARLPVYALFAAAIFPLSGGLVVFSLYMTGIVLAILTGLLLKKSLFKGETSHFIMELPPYHTPKAGQILFHTWNRLKEFIGRAGLVIVIAVTVLSFLNSIGSDGSLGNDDSQKSVLSEISRAITPVFTPMGIQEENWPATVGIFTGLFAKEAVVGTLNSLYGQLDQQQGDSQKGKTFDFWAGIRESLQTIPTGLSAVFSGLVDPLGLGLMAQNDTELLAQQIGADTTLFSTIGAYFKSPASAYAYLLFILLYFPCVAAFGVAIKEIGLFYGVLNSVYLTVLAWVSATLFYQISTAHDPFWIVFAVLLLALTIAGLIMFGRLERNRQDKLLGNKGLDHA